MINKRCILIGTMVAAGLVILNLSLNANVPEEPREIKVVCDSTKLPGINKDAFDVEFINLDILVNGRISIHRHVDGVLYGCDETMCKRLKHQWTTEQDLLQ